MNENTTTEPESNDELEMGGWPVMDDRAFEEVLSSWAPVSDRTAHYQVLMYWQPPGVDERMKCLPVGRPKLARAEAEALGAVMLAEVDTFLHVEVVPTVAACEFALPGFGLVCSKPHEFVIAGQHLCSGHVVRLYPDVIARGVETIEPQA